jgi:hypothetical protein
MRSVAGGSRRTRSAVISFYVMPVPAWLAQTSLPSR